MNWSLNVTPAVCWKSYGFHLTGFQVAASVHAVLSALSTLLSGFLITQLVMHRRELLQTSSNRLVFSLVASILLFTLPSLLYLTATTGYSPTLLNPTACSVVAFTFVLGLTGMQSTLVGLTIDRYYFSINPMTHHFVVTHFRVGLFLTAIWLHAFLVSVQPFFSANSFVYMPRWCACTADWKLGRSYSYYVVIVVLVVPYAFNCYVKVQLIRHIRRQDGMVQCRLQLNSCPAEFVKRMRNTSVLRRVVSWSTKQFLVNTFCCLPLSVAIMAELWPSLGSMLPWPMPAQTMLCIGSLLFPALHARFARVYLKRLWRWLRRRQSKSIHPCYSSKTPIASGQGYLAPRWSLHSNHDTRNVAMAHRKSSGLSRCETTQEVNLTESRPQSFVLPGQYEPC